MGRAHPLCQKTLRLCKGLDMDKRLTLGDEYSAFNMVKIEPRPQTILIPQTRSINNGNKREQLLLKVLVLKVAFRIEIGS